MRKICTSGRQLKAAVLLCWQIHTSSEVDMVFGTDQVYIMDQNPESSRIIEIGTTQEFLVDTIHIICPSAQPFPDPRIDLWMAVRAVSSWKV